MIRYHLSLIALILIGCILQQFVPVITPLYDARALILPLVFLCAAVTVRLSMMLLLAFLAGFLWDAQHYLGSHGGDPGVYTELVPSLSFGYSILLYGFMGFIMQSMQPLFRRGLWQVSVLLTGVATFLYLFAEFSLITFVRGEFLYPSRVFLQISLTAALTMIGSPLVFAFLFRLAKACDYIIRYDGLRRRYFTPETPIH